MEIVELSRSADFTIGNGPSRPSFRVNEKDVHKVESYNCRRAFVLALLMLCVHQIRDEATCKSNPLSATKILYIVLKKRKKNGCVGRKCTYNRKIQFDIRHSF